MAAAAVEGDGEAWSEARSSVSMDRRFLNRGEEAPAGDVRSLLTEREGEDGALSEERRTLLAEREARPASVGRARFPVTEEEVPAAATGDGDDECAPELLLPLPPVGLSQLGLSLFK